MTRVSLRTRERLEVLASSDSNARALLQLDRAQRARPGTKARRIALRAAERLADAALKDAGEGTR